MINRLFHRSTSSLLVIFLFIAQWQIVFVRLDNDRIKNVIGSDGTGYYEYLPKTFIKKDYPYALWGDKKNKEAIKPEQLISITGGPANKYFFGEALVISPFYFVADFLTQALRPDMRDGYSSYYQIAISFAALTYLLLGLWMIHRMLRRMNYAQEIINLILVILFLGTNLYYYGLQEPSMSHVYSFAFVSIFLDQLHLQIQNPKNSRWILLAFFLSIIVFIRPVNALLILAIFPLVGSFTAIRNLGFHLINKPIYLLISLIIPILFIGIQSAFYYAQSGTWWIDSYGDEGFNFSKPEIINVLFSFRKGLFVYTPLMLLIFPGLWVYKQREGVFSFFSWIVLWGILIYVISSWWYWAYGGSFGMRPIIDLYPLMVLPIAAFAERMYRSYLKFRFFLILIAFGLFLNLLQTWQYVQSIIPYEGMNRARYAHIFLETQRHFRFIYPAETTGEPFNHYSSEVVFSKKAIGDEVVCVGDQPGKIKVIDFIANPFKEILKDSILPLCWLEIEGQFKMEDASSDASFIISIQNEECWYWNRRYLIQSIDISSEWREILVKIDLPDFHNPNDKFTVSLLNEAKSQVEARQVQIKLFRK